jgi:uncharacterized membrane protein YjfL (UPF0719 family)
MAVQHSTGWLHRHGWGLPAVVIQILIFFTIAAIMFAI